ncbi:MAG: ATP-binding protein [Bacteroidota bacterium]
MESPPGSELTVSIIISLIAGVFMVILVFVFMKRKNKLILNQERTKKEFERELAETQIEIREETMRNISWELHDNIGQIMTLAKVKAQNAGDDPQKMKQAAKLIGQGLDELRALSKIINPEAIKKLTLKEAVQLEIERFNRLRFIEATLSVEGEQHSIGDSEQIIIFRILQEFFSNTIKHSQATNLNVSLNYGPYELFITANDNGVGFIHSEAYSGIGLKNMKTRARLINAHLEINSEENRGTNLTLVYPFDKSLSPDK